MINSRDKGARFERSIANYLTENGFTARRGCQFKGTPDSPDVICDNFPMQIECKNVQNLNIHKALDKALLDAEGPACVIHKKNNSKTLITMELDQFMTFIKHKNTTTNE